MFLTKLFNVKSKIRTSASVQIKFSIRLNFAHAVEDYRRAKVWPEEAPLQYSMAFSSCILATRYLLIWQKWEFLYCHKNLGLNDQDRKIYGIIFICCHIGNYPPWILLRVKIGIIYKGFCKKWFFKVSKLVFFSSHYRAFGSTIPKKIFFPKIFFWGKIFLTKNIFGKNIFFGIVEPNAL